MINNIKSIYLGAFILGTLVPGYFIISFMVEYGFNLTLFAQKLFSNNASATFSSDLLIVSFTFWIFMYFDKKYKTPNPLWFIALNLSVGLSSALPLYFYFRERWSSNG